VNLIWTSDVAWRLFETTGSIWAYLAYRGCTGNAWIVGWVSPN
jgi:hypothetical protein